MAEPPDQSNQVLPKDFKWPEPTPLDTEQYKVEPPQREKIPAAREIVDNTTLVQGAGGAKAKSQQDVVSELSKADVARLLAANNIDLADRNASGQALMRGYSFADKALDPANKYGIRIANVTCHPGDNESTTGQSITYSEVISNLERQTSAAAKAGVGIPSIFKFDASFTNSVATAERDAKVRIYFQSSQRVPKAVVSIERRDISLDADLVVAPAQKAVTAGDAEALLDILRDYGHFVPTSIVLGGRLTLSTSTELDDQSNYKTTENKLTTAADARFTVEGTPVEAGGGVGGRAWDKYEESIVLQAKKLEMHVRGGTGSEGSSVPGELSGKWVDSVGPFMRWRNIGFTPDSLIPITDLFESPLKEKCIELLRAYFVSKLRVARTARAGSAVDDIFGSDNDETLKRVKRISGFTVDHGINFDGFRWKFDFYPKDGLPSEGSVGYKGDGSDILGGWYGEKDKLKEIKLDQDERIVSIEACGEPGKGISRIAFRTNKGRYPDEGFYGRLSSATEVKLIQAPRVIGFHGYKRLLVHALGLCYLKLGDNTHSPDFLEKMEPILFPKRDFGPIGAT